MTTGIKFIVREACKKTGVKTDWPLRFLSLAEFALTIYLIIYAFETLSVTGYCMAQLHEHMPFLFNKSDTRIGVGDYLHTWDWCKRTYSIGEIVDGIKERPP